VQSVNKVTIVIVDDDSVMRNALALFLAALGYDVESYGSASEFLAVAATTEAACLVVDIQLGDMTGIEMARKLVAGGIDLPFIFMTGSNDEQMRREAISFGTVAYLIKPFRVEDLMSALSQAIGPH
jgi:FixJ family two-component response regulator